MNRLFFVALLVVSAASTAEDSALRVGQAASALDALSADSASAIPVQQFRLPSSEMDALLRLKPGQALTVPGLNLGLAKSAPLAFRRIHLYASNARVRVDNKPQPRPVGREFFIASTAHNAAAIAVDSKTRAFSGVLVDSGAILEIAGVPADQYLEVVVKASPDTDAPFSCGTDSQLHSVGKSASSLPYTSQSLAPKGGNPLFQTVIAVDTDTDFTSQPRFSSTQDVVTWIEDLFLAMNAIYERDLSLHLLIGDTFINTVNDPYEFEDDDMEMLKGLGAFTMFWSANGSPRANVDRDFAMVLAGIGGGFSGSAWLGAYCSSGFSYSYNGIGSSFGFSRAAEFVGHEIGHNLGAGHTHCEKLANGGTQFVDQCYSCEAIDGEGGCSNRCYVGPTMCQPGNTGSIMSYCHAGASGFDGSGPAEGTSDNCQLTGEFHPLIVGKINDRMAANYPSCIEDFTPPTYQVGVLADGPGRVTSLPAGIDCSDGRCIAGFDAGVNVTLSATPDGAGRLIGWGDACLGSPGDQCVVQANQDLEVRAVFVGEDVLIQAGFEQYE